MTSSAMFDTVCRLHSPGPYQHWFSCRPGDSVRTARFNCAVSESKTLAYATNADPPRVAASLNEITPFDFHRGVRERSVDLLD